VEKIELKMIGAFNTTLFFSSHWWFNNISLFYCSVVCLLFVSHAVTNCFFLKTFFLKLFFLLFWCLNFKIKILILGWQQVELGWIFISCPHISRRVRTQDYITCLDDQVNVSSNFFYFLFLICVDQASPMESNWRIEVCIS
jgi:hypothetical protein